MELRGKLGLVAAAGLLSWAAVTTPASAIEPETASVTWEFRPQNGTGARCSLRASALVNTYKDGRVAIGSFYLLDDDPACRPRSVTAIVDYTATDGERRRSSASAGRPESLDVIGDDASGDADAVVQVWVYYDGCADPARCTTGRELHPK